MLLIAACFKAMRRQAVFSMALIFLLAAGAVPARAQPAPQAVPSTAELTSLVQTLQTPQQRQALISDLQALIAARNAHAAPPPAPHGAGATMVSILSSQAAHIGGAVTALAHLAPRTHVSAWVQAFRADPKLRARWFMGAASGAAVLVAGLLAFWLLRVVLGPLRRRVQSMALGPVWARVLGAMLAILLHCLPVLALLAAGYAVLGICQAAGDLPGPARVLILAALNAMALVRAVMAIAGALLLPAAAGVRFLPVGEATADYVLVWVARFSSFTIYGLFALEAARNCGLDQASYDGLLKVFGLSLLGLLTMLILQNHDAVARVIGGPAVARTSGFARLRGRLAQWWHIAAILYLLGAYGVWAAGVPGGFAFLLRASVLSLVIVIAARLVEAVAGALLTRFLTVRPELEQRLPGLQQRANRYTPFITGIGRLLLYALAALLVLQAWGLGGIAWLETTAGQRLVGGLVTIALAAIFLLAFWEIVVLSAEFYVTRPDADGTPLERSARIRTVLPLFRKSLAIVLGIAFVLIALATVGVNIAPLLAGAGIFGIAVGFGAQSLVKDVITGIFILMQDAVSVGDVAEMAGHAGLVEKISIRSVRLRDFGGTVITIPFSEVTTVQNMTKEFSQAVFNIGVAYREDIDEVIKVVTALGQEFMADEQFAARILAPLEVVGLDSFADSAAIVKARFKTVPGAQWAVMRAFNGRMKRRFDELGIEIPIPNQRVYFGEDRQGKAPPLRLRVPREEEARDAAV